MTKRINYLNDSREGVNILPYIDEDDIIHDIEGYANLVCNELKKNFIISYHNFSFFCKVERDDF